MTKVQSKNAILFDIENDAGPLRDAMVATIGEGTTVEPGLISAVDKAKLDGIAAGATVNASDTALRDRATHTGEQAIGTITGLVDALAGKATPADVASALAGLVDSSPATLDTLNELAAALGDDPEFATTVSTALGNRLRVDAAQGLSAPQQAQGRENLGLGSAALAGSGDFATAAQGALANTALQVVPDGSVTNAKLADAPEYTIPGRAIAGDGPVEYLTGDQVAVIIDPDEKILTGIGLKLAYHKARGALPIKAFGTSLTEVGGGSAAVDTVALQNAMDSGAIIDLTGAQLKVSDVIVCNVQSSKIGAAIASHRPALTGSPNSQISVDDNELPVVFQVGHDNFEASNFCIRGNDGNELTTAFWFERTVDTYRDIDCRLLGMSVNRMGRLAYHKGRGIETSGLTISDLHIAGIELDQPATWTPRGSTSIDGIDTGTRGYRFTDTRAHAMFAPVIKNTGPYALNIGGIMVNGIMADIGCDSGVFNGVMIDLQAQHIQCRYGLQGGSRILELLPGSRNVNLTNFNAAGYVGASGNRLANHAVRMTSSLANPIRDIFFNVGTMGPTLQAAVNFLGDGAFDNIVFNSVVFQGIGQDGGARSPLQVLSTVPSTMIKLIGTHGRDNFTSRPFFHALNAPANNTLYRELTATIDGSFSAWATSGVVQPPY